MTADEKYWLLMALLFVIGVFIERRLTFIATTLGRMYYHQVHGEKLPE